MSALRPSDVVRVERIAWRAFRELDLGFVEIYHDEVFDRVLEFVTSSQYEPATLTHISLAVEENYYGRDHLSEWMGLARTNRQRIERLAAHSIVRQLRAMVGFTPRHGNLVGFAGWVFLGRFSRNIQELPLTPAQIVVPKAKDLVVDLWGRRDGSAVTVHGVGIDAHITELADPCDSHAREAFRRVAREVVPA